MRIESFWQFLQVISRPLSISSHSLASFGRRQTPLFRFHGVDADRGLLHSAITGRSSLSWHKLDPRVELSRAALEQ